MAEHSKLIIEVSSDGVVTANGNLIKFSESSQKAGKSTDDLANKMGALQLIANKLPGPLKSVAAGLMGMVNPTTAVVGVLIELGEAAVKYIGEAVNAYAEHEAQLVRLGAVIKASGAETWTTTDALSRYADTLQSATGKSSNQIKQMQSVLLGFQSITGENFDRLTKNMLDMVDVMGGDMVTAANTFGKAMDNPAESLSALSRYGFKFTEQEKQMIKSMQEANDIAGAQVVILKSMEKAFGGAAEAHAKTLQGMKEYVKTLKEQHKALQAEYSGMSDIAKYYYEQQVERYEMLNAQMQKQIESKGFENKRKSGTLTVFEEYEEAIKIVEDLKKRIEALNNAGYKTHAPELQKELDLYNSIIANYKPFIDAEKKRTTELEKQLKIIEDQKKQYASTMDLVKSILENTPEAQAEKIRAEIKQLELLLDIGKKPDHHTQYDSHGNVKEWDKLKSLEPKDMDKTKEAIAVLEKKLEELIRKGKGGFEDWVKILARATGYAEDTVNKLGGLKTVEKYIADIEKIQNTLFSQDDNLLKALGLDDVGILETSADKARSALELLLNSGIWDGTEKSVQSLTKKLEELDRAASYSRFTKVMEDLEKERKLLGSSPQERVHGQVTDLLKSKNIDPSELQILEYIRNSGENYLAGLAEQLRDAGKSTYDLALKRLMIEQNISEEAAKQALETQKKIDYIKKGLDIIGKITEAMDNSTEAIRKCLTEWKELGGVPKELYGEYAEARFAQSGMNIMQGSDVGNFVHGMEMGGPIVGLINMFAGALENVLGGMEGMDLILSPITNMLKQLEPLIKTLLLPLLLVGKALEWLGQAIMWVLNFITGGFFGQMSDLYDTLLDTNDQRKTEAERLRALNEQYSKLYLALKEQEEYYLQQRRHLNSEWAIENYQTRTVNDMILSPHGVFRTDPEDYIIATKHPENLAGDGTAQVNIIVINNSDSGVSTQESVDPDGARNIQITIDKVVQNGFASGRYDNALDAASSRRAAKRVIG